MNEGQNAVAAPQFAELGGSLKSHGSGGIMSAGLPQMHGGLEEKRGRTGQQIQGEEGIESNKDFSHLLQVFNIYKNKESFN